MTSADAGSLCSILFPLPAPKGRTHLRTSADCIIACLCGSLTPSDGMDAVCCMTPPPRVTEDTDGG
jgi:hypothetical protein